MTVHIDVPRSTAEIGSRDGGPVGSPLLLTIPLYACTSASNEGSYCIGPASPKLEIAQ